MNIINRKLSITLSICAFLGASAGSAIADNGVIDSKYQSNDQSTADLDVPAKYTYADAGHAIAGVAMRNRIDGTIGLRGVPKGKRVQRAYIYVNMQAAANEKLFLPLLFEGNKVTSRLIARNPDLCWGSQGNYTYRADVTPFIPTWKPNQDYDLTVLFSTKTNTSGESPWYYNDSSVDFSNGAALVVVYKDMGSGPVSIYDEFSGGSMSSGSYNFMLDSYGLYPDYPTAFSMAGADGQNNSSGEKSYFNTVQIAGEGAPNSASDWDGSTGWPTVQLFDVVSHNVVTSATDTETVTYDIGVDCVAPVVMVLDQ